MSITLGAVTFDEARTTVREKHEEVGGRDGRIITLSGLILGESSLQALDARLDGILAAASEEDYAAALSLRPGRRLWVRRLAFAREVARERLAGSFELRLEARDPFEESVALHTVEWPIAASGDSIAIAPSGNAPSQPTIALVATGDLVNPSIGDGVRSLAYAGTVAAGQTLVFDSAAGRVTLDGSDVTPYVSGAFPLLDPAGTTLTYADAAGSSHLAAVSVAYRDRWW